MRRILIESPFAGRTRQIEEEHKRYARLAVLDALIKKDAALALHLTYTQPGITDDHDPKERAFGINAGIEWYKHAEASVVYTDCGISRGVTYGIAKAERHNLPVEYREIAGWQSDLITQQNGYQRHVPTLEEGLLHPVMPCIVVATPYTALWDENDDDITYARHCLSHALHLGEAPMAFHLLYAQPGILDLNRKADRKVMQDAKNSWLAEADCLAVYTDCGITDQMRRDIDDALALGKKVDYRAVPKFSA